MNYGKKQILCCHSWKKTGIYGTWDECKAQTEGVSGAKYKSFSSLEEFDKKHHSFETHQKQNYFFSIFVFLPGKKNLWFSSFVQVY